MSTVASEKNRDMLFIGNVFLVTSLRVVSLVGSLRNDDDEGNENGKKATGLDKQNNNFARASRFFVHFWEERCVTTLKTAV